VREFPVFGVLEGVFFMGVIDELMYNQKGELVLNELKTRKHNSMPSSAQDKVNCLQVSWSYLLQVIMMQQLMITMCFCAQLPCFPWTSLCFHYHIHVGI